MERPFLPFPYFGWGVWMCEEGKRQQRHNHQDTISCQLCSFEPTEPGSQQWWACCGPSGSPHQFASVTDFKMYHYFWLEWYEYVSWTVLVTTCNFLVTQKVCIWNLFSPCCCTSLKNVNLQCLKYFLCVTSSCHLLYFEWYKYLGYYLDEHLTFPKSVTLFADFTGVASRRYVNKIKYAQMLTVAASLSSVNLEWLMQPQFLWSLYILNDYTASILGLREYGEALKSATQ